MNVLSKIMSINKWNLNIHSFIRSIILICVLISTIIVIFNYWIVTPILSLTFILSIGICRWIYNYEIQFISATHVAASRRETQKPTQRWPEQWHQHQRQPELRRLLPLHQQQQQHHHQCQVDLGQSTIQHHYSISLNEIALTNMNYTGIII